MLLAYFLTMVKNREERGHPPDGNCKRAGARPGQVGRQQSGGQVRWAGQVCGWCRTWRAECEQPEAEGFHLPANLAEAVLGGQEPISAVWLRGRGRGPGQGRSLTTGGE